MAGPLLKDALWAKQPFIVNPKNLAKLDQQNRFFTTASTKFVDTTLGGNMAINPPPQFTRFADPKVKGTFSASKGLGRYYSEKIDDNSQLINLRFGLPAFNSLSKFFSGFYNSAAGTLARTGRATSIFYDLGRVAGMVVGVIFWPLLAVSWVGQVTSWLLNKPSSKYCYLKPAMPLYWNAVQTIVNQIAVNRGIVPRIGGSDAANRIGGPYEFDDAALKLLAAKLPDIFKGDGTVDVYAVSTRAQRLATKRYKAIRERADNMGNADFAKVLQEVLNDKSVTDSGTSFEKYRNAWLNSQPSKPKSATDDKTAGNESADYTESGNAGFGDFLEAELNDGGAFVTFRVNSTGAVQESFNNSTGESDIASKINGASSSSRSTNFSFAGGNLIDSEMFGKLAGYLKDTVSGVMDSLNISGLAALTGAAYADIPEHWKNSVANLPHSSYSLTLGGPYGNPISQLMNIYIPLAMLLAGSLPLSTGRQSYTSPFVMEIYDKGRCQSRYAMIDSISITRGTSNLGFNSDGNFLQLDVTFTYKDLSSIMHMPIAEGFSMSAMETGINIGAAIGTVAGGATGAAVGTTVGAAAGATVDAAKAIGTTISTFFDDQTVFTDYMAVLGSQGLADQIYNYRRLKLNLTRSLTNLKTFFSAAHYASFVGDSIPARMISAIYKGTER